MSGRMECNCWRCRIDRGDTDPYVEAYAEAVKKREREETVNRKISARIGAETQPYTPEPRQANAKEAEARRVLRLEDMRMDPRFGDYFAFFSSDLMDDLAARNDLSEIEAAAMASELITQLSRDLVEIVGEQ